MTILKNFILIILACLSLNGNSQLLSESELSKKEVYTTVSQALVNPSNVYRLSLTDYDFSKDPFLISRFTNCQVLDLSRCKNVTAVPYSINKLVNLQYINFSSTQVEFIASYLKKLKKLKLVCVANTKVNQFEQQKLTKKGITVIDKATNIPKLFNDILSSNVNESTSSPVSALETSEERIIRENKIINDSVEVIKKMAAERGDELFLNKVNSTSHRYTLSMYTPSEINKVYLGVCLKGQTFNGSCASIIENSGVLVRKMHLNSQEELDLFLSNIDEFPNLISLKINFFDEILTLDNQLLKLKKLENLELSADEVVLLPDLRLLPKLKHLYLPNMKKYPDFIGELTQLETLSIENTVLSTIPSQFFKLTQLKSFSFRGTLFGESTQITSISGISKFINLEYLDLSNNRKLKSFGGELRGLNKLKYLNIHSTQIYELPEYIGELKQLESFIYYGGDIANFKPITLPESFSNLYNLKYLDVWNMNDVPGIENFINLEYLTLGLKNKTIDLSKLVNLKSLTITVPANFGVPQWISKLTKLEKFTLNSTGSKGSILPDDIGNLTELKQLSLRKAGISLLPESLSKCSKLEVLILGNNELMTIPSVIYKLPSLKTFTIEGCPIPQEEIDLLRKSTKIKVNF
jgi:Leucine-rich repeat (LRR) protein